MSISDYPKPDQAEPTKLIELKNIGYSVNNQTILTNISFAIRSNEIVTIIGPNGAGKSSLVKIIANLNPVSNGTITRQKNLKLGYVPQKLHLDNSMPVKVSRFLSLAGISRNERKNALEMLGIEHLQSKQMSHLSGGELQRVLLARAAARQPDLLILDEPLQGVDVNGQSQLYKLISKLRDKLSCAILMVSHDLHLVMAQTDSVICLNQHVCCHGIPENVSKHPEYLKLFGKQAAEEIAIYTHNHDHHHTIDGGVEECDSGCPHD